MKFILLLTAIIFLKPALSQVDITDDSAFQNLIKEAKENNWIVTIQDDILRLQLKDSVYTMHGNWINASIDHMESKHDSAWVVGNGKAGIGYVEYKIRPREDTTLIYFTEYYSDHHILRFLELSPALSHINMEPQYTGSWPRSAERFIYILDDLLQKYLSSKINE